MAEQFKIKQEQTESLNAKLPYFFTESLKYKHDLAKYLCSFSDKILLIHSDGKNGKTAFANALVATSKNDFNFIRIDASSLDGLNIASHFKDLKKNHLPIIIIIDNIDKLNIDDFSDLYAFYTKTINNPRLKLVFLSNKDYNQIIPANKLQHDFEKATHRIEIKAFTKVECARFCYSIVKTAKINEDLLTDKMLEKVYDKSKGVAGEIINLLLPKQELPTVRVLKSKGQNNTKVVLTGVILLMLSVGLVTPQYIKKYNLLPTKHYYSYFIPPKNVLENNWQNYLVTNKAKDENNLLDDMLYWDVEDLVTFKVE